MGHEAHVFTERTALVTGAASGVGLEAAFQLARAGYGRVVLGCRTAARCAEARAQLLARGVADVFDAAPLDVAEAASSAEAGTKLLASGTRIDLLLLNAGAVTGAAIERNSTGVDMIFASTLIGHHALTTRLAAGGGLTDSARIIIAGSEAARGDLPGMALPDLDRVVQQHFGDDLNAALRAFATASYPPKRVPSAAYALAKLYVAWWAKELARRLPGDMCVFAVSPGNTPTTDFSRNLPWLVRRTLIPVLRAIGPAMGVAHAVDAAAARYLEVARRGRADSGKFYASRPGKMAGPLIEQHTRWLDDRAKATAAYALLVELADGLDVASSPASTPQMP